LSDKSTSNVSIDTIDAEINELTEREKELEAQLRELEGDSGMEGSGGCEG
jgi:prefoldin subunit 5